MEFDSLVIITGGTRGIGFELVKKSIANYPNSLIIFTGSSDNSIKIALEAFYIKFPLKQNQIYPVELDLSSSPSIQLAIDKIKELLKTTKSQTISYLYNNAGKLSVVLNYASQKEVFQVNLLGLKEFTEGLLPYFADYSTIIMTSSKLGSFAPYFASQEFQQQLKTTSPSWEMIQSQINFYLGNNIKNQNSEISDLSKTYSCGFLYFYAYGHSKTLLNQYIKLLSIQCPKLKIVGVCPGRCKTDLSKGYGERTAEQGANSIIKGGRLSHSGDILDYDCNPIEISDSMKYFVTTVKCTIESYENRFIFYPIVIGISFTLYRWITSQK